MPVLTLLPSTVVSGVGTFTAFQLPPNATDFVSVLSVTVESVTAAVVWVETSPDGTTWFPLLKHADLGSAGDDTGIYCHSTIDTTAGSPRQAMLYVRGRMQAHTGISITYSHLLQYGLR